ncbi:sensor N-terminal transmembrane domain-containing protein [Rhodobaculum claviforme]|uniref:sensor N-terminal transmembrane domain-containing protein n=1 Tax=Rhodobaculum claviforme TaxID=1549854 RepID=UPI003B849FD5
MLPRGGGASAQVLRGVAGLRGSPLARRIVVVNLLALMVLVAGVVWLNPFRDGLVQQRGAALADQAGLIAGLLGPGGVPADALSGHPGLPPGVMLSIHDATGAAVSGADGAAPPGALVAAALAGAAQVDQRRNSDGHTVLTAVVPVRAGGQVVGAVALTGAAGEADRIAHAERVRMAQVFVLALLVSIGLSLVLASTIATPIAELAAAAERGRERNARHLGPGRVRIPDLAARPDEIGRLSSAMRGMVAALYDRIEMNEQFAADVAHEIKNPLASLRSAVGTLRVARRDDQRGRLLDVIEHDVRRLDRLVSDISNASRLDSELVKEQEARFDLVPMLRNLSSHFGAEAEARGVDFITDLPAQTVQINGLEARLAQVFVNIIANALSFCEDGDAVRLWARRRDNRVLVVVEDTGPGIPDAALTKIFKRFYSERPVQQFGNHSGLGLAISRQIVEAHGGVIWAENIQPTEADPGSEPLGARFVVGLPV